MKRTIALCVLALTLAVTLVISCAKKSSPEDQKNCKMCKVFGGDNNNVIHEEKVCTDEQEKNLHDRFPGREIKCQ